MVSRKTSVTAIVIAAVVTVTTLLLGTFGAVNYLNTKNRELENVRLALVLDADQIAPSLALPVWNFDRPQLDKVVESMMRDTILLGMVVESLDGKTVICARARDAQWNVRVADKEFTAGEFMVEKRHITFSGDALATVTLFATTKFVEAELRKILLWTVVNIFALDLILTLSLYLLLRRWVFKPLQEVEAFAATVSAGGRAVHISAFRGELESLRASIEKMIGQLEARNAQLQTEIDERRQAETELLASRGQLRALLTRLQRAREEERVRVSREIHDELGQLLTGLKMDVRWLERKLSQPDLPPALNPLLDRAVAASALADATIATVQKIAAELRPGALDQLGLAAALTHEARRFQERSGVPCAVTVAESWPVLPPETASELFYICQEALTNVARHAHAKGIEITLRTEGNDALLEVVDDGVGLPDADLNAPRSLGLTGMRERAGQCGGTISFTRNEPQGTRVAVRLPRAGVVCETRGTNP